MEKLQNRHPSFALGQMRTMKLSASGVSKACL
jgi:hypothetical protein